MRKKISAPNSGEVERPRILVRVSKRSTISKPKLTSLSKHKFLQRTGKTTPMSRFLLRLTRELGILKSSRETSKLRTSDKSSRRLLIPEQLG